MCPYSIPSWPPAFEEQDIQVMSITHLGDIWRLVIFVNDLVAVDRPKVNLAFPSEMKDARMSLHCCSIAVG